MPPTLHAQLGASSAERWMNCPGSITLSEGLEDSGSPYAWEGTAAHTLAERCLRNGEIPQMAVGEYIAVEVREEVFELIEVTEEMAEAVDLFVEHVRGVVKSAPEDAVVSFERRFDLSPLKPPVPMFGTADVVIWLPKLKKLTVIDLKYGKGVVVNAHENVQTMYYALGATVANGVIPDEVKVTICQPRAHHDDGPVRSFQFDRQRLIEFKKELFAAALRTQEKDAPLAVGDWCKFCRAKAVCPAQRANAIALMDSEFDTLPPEEVKLPAPGLLTLDQVATILSRAGLVMDWLREVESYALELAERGTPVPGFKLVEKKTNRKWTDEEKVEAYLARYLKKDERTKTKVISPAQAEKLMKARGAPIGYLQKLWEKPTGGSKLVPSSDSRPEVSSSIEQDFGALTEAPPASGSTSL